MIFTALPTVMRFFPLFIFRNKLGIKVAIKRQEICLSKIQLEVTSKFLDTNKKTGILSATVGQDNKHSLRKV